MGDFNATCGVTRVAIGPDDPIMIIYVPDRPDPFNKSKTYNCDYMRNSYDMLGALRREPSYKNQELGNWDADDRWSHEAKYIQVLRGTYDQYGWINEDKNGRPDIVIEDRVYPIIYIHLAIAKRICDLMGVDFGQEDQLYVAQAIFRWCFLARVEIFSPDMGISGGQYCDKEEIAAKRELLKMITDMVDYKDSNGWWHEYDDEEYEYTLPAEHSSSEEQNDGGVE